jgi:hypothetical protein
MGYSISQSRSGISALVEHATGNMSEKKEGAL